MTLRGAGLALMPAMWLCACSGPPPPAPRQTVTVTRPAVSWQGSGSRTIDFNSESGKFHITWATRRQRADTAATFTLTVHSAVSGRPLQLITDREGKGTTLFQDDPRPYNFMIESANVEWSVTAEEIVTVVTKQ